MTLDFSHRILDKYFSLSKSDVLITITNKQMIRCELIGYFKNDDGTIHLWHVAPVAETLNQAIDVFGYLEGILIEPNHITAIQFDTDNSIIHNHSRT